ncbi:MAG: OmpA family protein [Flavobacteriales bacterium]|nr:OmpA family protein [Flavobacteriales bacterium]
MNNKALQLLFLITAFIGYSQNEDALNSFGKNNEDMNNFEGKIYYLPQSTSRLPDFSTLEPVGTIYTPEIDVKKQSFHKGFPGVTNRNEYFGIVYKAQFYIDENFKYCFSLGSDDGSKLFIDDQLIIDNDGTHSLKYERNCVDLKEGLHSIEVQYFQGPKYDVALTLRYKKFEEAMYRPFNLQSLSSFQLEDNKTETKIAVSGEVLFAYDSFELNDKATYVISQIKDFVIDKTMYSSIIIVGHTDDTGSDEYNLKLSKKRAQAVQELLISKGISPELIKTIGLGESTPVVSNDTPQNRKKNRRIEITVVK